MGNYVDCKFVKVIKWNFIFNFNAIVWRKCTREIKKEEEPEKEAYYYSI